MVSINFSRWHKEIDAILWWASIFHGDIKKKYAGSPGPSYVTHIAMHIWLSYHEINYLNIILLTSQCIVANVNFFKKSLNTYFFIQHYDSW